VWSRVLTVLVVAGVAAVVVAAVVNGWEVQREPRVKLGAAPLVGAWEWRLTPALLPAAMFAAVAVPVLPRLAVALPFRWLLAVAGGWGAAFTVALAAADGWSALLAPVVHPTEYWANVDRLPPAGTVLREWGVDFLLGYSVHVKGHPPGFVLLLQGLEAVHLGRPWVAGALSFLGAAATPIAVLVALRAAVSDEVARRAAPFLVVVPYAVWMGTSADAFFTAVTAWGVAATALALRAATAVGRRWLGAVSGLVLAAGLFLTYGAAVLLVVPVALVLLLPGVALRARVEVAVTAAAAAALVAATFAAAGFWWLDGLRATQTLYWWGTAQFRPGGYFVYANLAAAAIAVGPAVVVGLAALRDRRVWLVVGAALAALVVADLSQYSRAEVERIWLLFFPWLVPAVVALRRVRWWLAIQALAAVGLQAALVSKW
jgi:methylthioxylose transferase